jgi:hypothetical protein
MSNLPTTHRCFYFSVTRPDLLSLHEYSRRLTSKMERDTRRDSHPLVSFSFPAPPSHRHLAVWQVLGAHLLFHAEGSGLCSPHPAQPRGASGRLPAPALSAHNGEEIHLVSSNLFFCLLGRASQEHTLGAHFQFSECSCRSCWRPPGLVRTVSLTMCHLPRGTP